MIRKLTSFASAAMTAILVTACAVGPNYRRPKIAAPQAFRDQRHPSPDSSLADLPWWKIFRDDALQQLVREALANNHDLRIAITRIEQARAQLMQARAEFFPQLGYGGEATRQREPQQPKPPKKNKTKDEGGGDGMASTTSAPPPTTNRFTVAGNAAWELDLWGRIRRGNEAATARLLATEEARRGVVQSLVAEVAQSYFQLRELDLELEIARRNRDAFGQIVDIFTQQKEGGIASDLEISRATALQAEAAAAIPEIERQIALTENRLSLLLGRNPAAIHRGAALTAQYSPPAVPAGLPSALLDRRPDLREAEQELVAANAEIGVAVAEFLPKLDLTAALGVVSPQLSLLTSGDGNFWNATGAISGPLLQGGRLVGRYREAKAHRDETQLQYQRTALAAFVEVSGALVSRRKQAETGVQLERQVAALHNAVRLARERYTAGVSNYIELLDAQQQLSPAETALAQTRFQQLVTIVQLYKALGGGWTESERSRGRVGFRIRTELRD